MLLGGYIDVLDDVAVFDSSDALADWLGATKERECGYYDAEDPYFNREELSEEEAACRLMIDVVELDELDKVKDEIYDGAFWLIPPF